MIEHEVSIQSGEFELKGNLTLPANEGRFPAYLYISGSGPLDRDDNIHGQKLNNSRILAKELAERGIASLRYDKRGVGESSGDYMHTGHYELVQDAVALVSFLRHHEQVESDQVFVMGHSEGAIIAPQVSQLEPKVAGIILLAPFCQQLESILLSQAAALKQMVKREKGFKSWFIKLIYWIWEPNRTQRRLIRKIKQSRKDSFRFWLTKVPAKWFREILELDVAGVIRKTTVPTLLIGGEKDFQCDPADVAQIQQLIGGPVEGHVIPDMSHLLRREPGEPSIFNYKEQMKQDIMPQVIELIGSWFESQTGRAKQGATP